MLDREELAVAEALVRFASRRPSEFRRTNRNPPKRGRWLGSAPVLLFRPLAIEQFLDGLPASERRFRRVDYRDDTSGKWAWLAEDDALPTVHLWRTDGGNMTGSGGVTVARCACHHGAVEPAAFDGARIVLERRRATALTDSDWLVTVWRLQSLPVKPWRFPEDLPIARCFT